MTQNGLIRRKIKQSNNKLFGLFARLEIIGSTVVVLKGSVFEISLKKYVAILCTFHGTFFQSISFVYEDLEVNIVSGKGSDEVAERTVNRILRAKNTRSYSKWNIVTRETVTILRSKDAIHRIPVSF